MSDQPRGMVTAVQHQGRTLSRAHVWADSGYSTKTFATHAEAIDWIDGKKRAARDVRVSETEGRDE